MSNGTAVAQSSTTPKVFMAINAVQADIAMTGISKDRKTDGYGAKYNFRGIDDVYNALSPVLAKHKLVIVPRYSDRNVIERTTGKGSIVFYTTVRGEFDFISAEDGSKYTCVTFGEAMDSGDKGTNKAMSIAYKYACFQVFAIPTEGDNDPDATVHPPIQPMQQQPMQQQNNFVGLPAPLDYVARSESNGKLYSNDNKRIFSPEQFQALCNSVLNGQYDKQKFMDQRRYFYSQAQWETLRNL